MRRKLDWLNITLLVAATLLGVPLAWAIALPPLTLGGDAADRLPAWAQAILTAVTFAGALATQEMTRREARRDQREAQQKLEAEQSKTREVLSIATAISFKSDLINASSVADMLAEDGLPDSPAQSFAEIPPFLTICQRSLEAINLGQATEAVLKVIQEADTLRAYLSSCKNMDVFPVTGHDYVGDLARTLQEDTAAAIAGVDAIVYEREDFRLFARHAASKKS